MGTATVLVLTRETPALTAASKVESRFAVRSSPPPLSSCCSSVFSESKDDVLCDKFASSAKFWGLRTPCESPPIELATLGCMSGGEDTHDSRWLGK